MKTWMLTLIVGAAGASAAGSGCSAKLETGYQPRKLGSSEEIRRGYYAQPFTMEAAAARKYEQEFNDGRLKSGH